METFFKGNTLYREDSNGNYRKVNDIIPTNHWKLQETSGTDVNDSGSNPITLTNNNTTINQTGKIGKAYSFNGTDSYLRTNTVPNDAQGTIALWINSSDLGTIKNIITSTDNDTGKTVSFAFLSDNNLAIVINDGTGTDNNIQIANPNILDGNWHHLIFMSTGSEYKIYVDGTVKTLIVNEGLNDGKWFADVSSRDNFDIGAYKGLNLYNGLIEDLRYYNYALSEQEIMTIYNAGNGTLDQGLIKSYPTRKNPVNHWKLQEETGTVVNDSAGNNILTNNNATINQAGINGNKSYSFNGTSSYLDANGLPSSMNTSQGSFSLWVNFENANAFELPFGIGDKDANTRLALRRENSTNDLRLFFLQDASYNWDIEASNAIDNNVWMYITITHDGTAPKLYKNGVDITNFIDSTNLNAWIDNATGFDSFKIGAYDYNSVVNDNYFSGKISDFRYYDYALSEQEIKNIYNIGKGLLI